MNKNWIKNQQNKETYYAEHIKSNISELLSYFLLNTPVEGSDVLKISKDKCFKDKHIEWIKQLIHEGMFTKIPTMIENNKDNNKQIKEIYEILSQKLMDDQVSRNQKEKAKRYNLDHPLIFDKGPAGATLFSI
jgi:hypothetical protein